MAALASLAAAIFGVVLLTAVVWRAASRRHALPCPVWLRWMVELDNPFTKTNRAAVIIDNLGLLPGMRVLDVGCGPGRLTIPLAKEVGPSGHVVALDLQPGMLRRARTKAEAAGLGNIEFLEADISGSKLAGEQFDRALLVTVLGEITDQERALREIHGVLKPGGLLSVTEIVFDPHFQSAAAVRRLALPIGFSERSLQGNRLAYTLLLAKQGSAPNG